VWSPGARFNTMIVMEKRGLFASKDQDGAFRIWKIPKNRLHECKAGRFVQVEDSGDSTVLCAWSSGL
jgi:hypothetical protein